MIDKSYFDEEYFTKDTKSNYGPYGPAHDLSQRCREIVGKYNPKRLLDVGCAYGFFVAQFRMWGIDAYGIDISPYAIKMGSQMNFYAGKFNESKKNIDQNKDPYVTINGYIFEADAQQIPFPDNFFDLLVSWDVLEHIPEENIPKVAKELNRLSTRQYHSIATKVFNWDKDKSHVTIKPLSWWKQYLPNAELHGSEGEGR